MMVIRHPIPRGLNPKPKARGKQRPSQLAIFSFIAPYDNPTLTDAEQEELKACIGKERRIKIELFDKNDHLLLTNTLIVRATPYREKGYGWTLYDTQKLEAADETYLSEPLRTGRLGNCVGVRFDLNKK